ncbi:alpha/beta hydrolase-fold protein [Mollicutes bacterium LVI A0039]|nr:alpha/beta hydrolase-fold protein [Mollicutes bacterium LVI A0039]
MSTIRVNILSNELDRAVNISVILPIENEMPKDGYKTLYLLNGYTGDDLDWIHETRVKRIALEHNLAVIMPAGENSFYIDNPRARRNYAKFIGVELVEVMRKMFPLSTKREDTFIAGLSMGGYGALINGLKYHQTFSKIGTFSLALLNEIYYSHRTDENERQFICQTFGVDVEEIINTDMDPRYLIRKFKGSLPKIYMACGSDDYALGGNEKIHKVLEEYNVIHDYIIEPGDHDWDFWSSHIEKFITWLEVNK